MSKTNLKYNKRSTQKIRKKNIKHIKKEEQNTNSLFNFLKKYHISFNLFAILIITFLSILIYSNSFNSPFQFDDTLQIVKKDVIKDLNNFNETSYWTKINRRPLSYFTFALNYYFGGYNVTGYHIINLLIHILFGSFVYGLTMVIFNSPIMKSNSIAIHKNYIALFAALILISHPIQTQGVTYIVQRMTSLAAMFYVLSVLLYAHGRLRYSKEGLNKYSILFYITSFISGLLAIQSKQIAVTLPIMILLFEFFFIRNRKNQLYIKYLIVSIFILISFISLVIFLDLLPSETDEISRYTYLVTQLKVFVKYLQLLILPIHQNVDYQYALSRSIFGVTEILGLSIFLILITLGVLFFKKKRMFSFGIFWFIIALSVESSIIPIRDVIFEHRLYLPMVGYSLAIVSILFYFLPKRNNRTAIIILCLVVVSFSIATYKRNEVWKSEYTLWSDVTQKSPNKSRGWYNLGKISLDQDRFDQAIKNFNKALNLDPDNADTWFNLGLSWEKKGNTEKAENYYIQALKVEHDHVKALSNLGNLNLNMGKINMAIGYFQTAFEIEHKNIIVLQNLAISYYKNKDYSNAIKYNKKLLAIKPDNAIITNDIGLAYLNKGNYDIAIQYFEKVIQLNPSFTNAYIDLGTSYFSINDFVKATTFYEKALEIEPDNNRAKNFLQLARQRLD